MARLVITTSDSGAGHLKQSRIADRVITSHAFDTLVSGPVPDASGSSAFFEAREAAHDGDPSIRDALHEWNRPPAALRYWNELLALCGVYERVELWVDPTPNEQLMFVQSLCWLERHPALVDKLYVVHVDTPLGGRSAADMRTLQPCVRKIDGEALRLACHAWHAFCQPTPTAWFDLLAGDLDALPYLRRAVLLLLGELPAAGTALGSTERLAIEVVAPGAVRPRRFFEYNAQRNPIQVFGLGDELRILNRLAGARVPAVLGLQDTTFGLGTMPDTDRRKRYMASELSLSDLGRALFDGSDDFARHNPIHRWWGGTLLTNANLWRWDAERRRLLPPA